MGPGSPASPSPAAPVPSCSPLPAAVGPDVAGSLGEPENGGTFCLGTGQRLSVFLRVAPGQAVDGWGPINSSDTDTLTRVPNGALTLVRGVTAGIFEGRRAGVVSLSSNRAHCPPAASPCPAAWRATVVVSVEPTPS